MKHSGHVDFWKQVKSGEWEPETFKILAEYCEPYKIFIDIGAWNGVCSLFANQLRAVCHAIEPDPIALKYLKNNVKLNKADINIHNLCISDRNGLIEIHTQYSEGFGNSMSSILDRGLIADSIAVESLTLEYFINSNSINIDNVSLIKIDIEGGELALLKQAKEYLKMHKPTIYLSLHPFWFGDIENDIKEIADIIFDIYRIFDTNHVEYSKNDFLRAIDLMTYSFILIK